MHACHMKKKEIWCPSKNCKNNVLWIRAETIHEHMLEKGFIDNYSIWTKHGETSENVQGNNTEQEREENNIDSDHMSHDSHGDVEELLHNMQHEELLENRKRGFERHHEKRHIIVPGKQRIIRVDNVTDEEEYNQFNEVSFFI
jgi:hypothetical protein